MSFFETPGPQISCGCSWVHVGQLDGLTDLVLQALGPSPGDRELDCQGVPQVLRVLVVEVGGHDVGVMVGPDVRLV